MTKLYDIEEVKQFVAPILALRDAREQNLRQENWYLQDQLSSAVQQLQMLQSAISSRMQFNPYPGFQPFPFPSQFPMGYQPGPVPEPVRDPIDVWMHAFSRAKSLRDAVSAIFS
jgi:hypothetical protein